VPIQVESKADHRDTQLPPFEDDEEVDVIVQPLGDLIHQRRFQCQAGSPSSTFLLGLDQLRTETVELLNIEPISS